MFILTPNKDEDIDEDDLPLRWLVKKQGGSKEKEKVQETRKVNKT